MLEDLLGPIDEGRTKRGPKKGSRQLENIIQSAIIKMMRSKEWYIINMHGNEFQMGVPDLYCCHKRHGTRWVEVKVKDKYRFTPAQIDVFPELAAKGVGIWVLTGASEEQYAKLFKPANWWAFLDVMK